MKFFWQWQQLLHEQVWGDYLVNGTKINVFNVGYPGGGCSPAAAWISSDVCVCVCACLVTLIVGDGAGATACKPAQPNGGMPLFVPYLSQQFDIVRNESADWDNNRAVFIWMGANGEPDHESRRMPFIM
jgi:hypothetical protein